MILRRKTRTYTSGDLLRQTLLTHTAIYKVVGQGMGYGYILETVYVIGLQPGVRMRVSREAAERMVKITHEEAREIIYPTARAA